MLNQLSSLLALLAKFTYVRILEMEINETFAKLNLEYKDISEKQIVVLPLEVTISFCDIGMEWLYSYKIPYLTAGSFPRSEIVNDLDYYMKRADNNISNYFGFTPRYKLPN